MAGRQKVLGLPIGRRRKSQMPKVVAGGSALALALPALAKAKQMAGSRDQISKKSQAVTRRGGDGARPDKKSADRDRPERTASRNQNRTEEKGRSRQRSAGGRPEPSHKGKEEGPRDRDGGGSPPKETKKGKSTNIIESIDLGVPVRTAYNAWTEFTEFPSFMKKVENIEQESDEELTWTARIAWSDRTWKSHIIEQVPDHKIMWRSEGAKGTVDGTVTFHELAPDLTRILLVLEYHPQGVFEKFGNLWRAQGRRVRLEFKNFARHVMYEAALAPDEPEGWRGEIREGNVDESGTSEAQDEGEAPAEQESPSRGRHKTRSAEPEEKSEPSDEVESEPEGDADTDDEPARQPQGRQEPEYDDEEGEDGRDRNEARSSGRRQSPPVRRRRTASADNGDQDDEFGDESDGESVREERGRGGRVIGKASGRQVGDRQTSEGAKR